MARGNDPDAARELKERYGTTGNAEDLIDSNRARRDRVVATASNLPIDEPATEKLKVSSIKEDRGEVVDAVVRGRYVSYVYEDSQGRFHHGAQVRSGLAKGEAAQAEEHAGTDDDETAVSKLRAQHEAELQRIQAEHEQRVQEAVAEAEKKAQEKTQKAVEQAQNDASKADRDAQG